MAPRYGRFLEHLYQTRIPLAPASHSKTKEQQDERSEAHHPCLLHMDKWHPRHGIRAAAPASFLRTCYSTVVSPRFTSARPSVRHCPLFALRVATWDWHDDSRHQSALADFHPDLLHREYPTIIVARREQSGDSKPTEESRIHHDKHSHHRIAIEHRTSVVDDRLLDCRLNKLQNNPSPIIVKPNNDTCCKP